MDKPSGEECEHPTDSDCGMCGPCVSFWKRHEVRKRIHEAADQAQRIAQLEAQVSDARGELAGSTGLTKGDQIKIDSAQKILDVEAPAGAEGGG